MMQQYERIKTRHRDKILFFRLGDFYEMFKSDAKEASRILGLTLTARNGVPMCGIPYHAADSYIPKLLEAGLKVAICEQVKLPEGSKGIAEREVVEVITPGAIFDEHLLKQGDHNFIASISAVDAPASGYSLSFIDVSTGDLIISSVLVTEGIQAVLRDLTRYRPREVLVQESLYHSHPVISRELQGYQAVINRIPDWEYQHSAAFQHLCTLLGTRNLKAWGIEQEDAALHSVKVLLTYLEENAGKPIRHINSITLLKNKDYLVIDSSSQKNLELVRNLQDGGENTSLFSAINQTRTSMGRRLLKQWILHPLVKLSVIQARHEKVSALYHDQLILSRTRDILASALDLPRLTSRLSMDKAHPKDLLAIKKTLQSLINLFELLHGSPVAELFESLDMKRIGSIFSELDRAIADDPPTNILEGGIFRNGYDSRVDHLRDLEANGERLLEEYLQEERSLSGIASLKLKYNRVIGYFFELSKGQGKNAPSHFEPRQSLVTADRFSTGRLQNLADEIGNAREQLMQHEQELFLTMRKRLQEHISLMLTAGQLMAQADCLQSFAYQATLRGYTRPEVDEGSKIDIRMGRHPVVEGVLGQGEFVPNNLELGAHPEPFFNLITGPNMAGKSTYLRQNALIVLLAQIGSFVPAEQAHIGVVDRIFCRVGASDNLTRGESTFLVEMNETAHILRQAGSRSLVIMDEVGRGTSTQDGLSIAWAVCEYILNHLQCRTLFATHFHELSQLEHRGLRNMSLAVHEEEGTIHFLNKVIDGPSNNSYGLHVAQIAGIPDEIIFRAAELLEKIQSSNTASFESLGFKTDNRTTTPIKRNLTQRSLFGQDEMVLQELLHLDIDNMTPLQALQLLSRFKSALRES